MNVKRQQFKKNGSLTTKLQTLNTLQEAISACRFYLIWRNNKQSLSKSYPYGCWKLYLEKKSVDIRPFYTIVRKCAHKNLHFHRVPKDWIYTEASSSPVTPNKSVFFNICYWQLMTEAKFSNNTIKVKYARQSQDYASYWNWPSLSLKLLQHTTQLRNENNCKHSVSAFSEQQKCSHARFMQRAGCFPLNYRCSDFLKY